MLMNTRERGRIMGLDFGSKTVGVAISDASNTVASAREIIRRSSPSKLRKTLSRIEELIGENDISLVVVGNPLMLRGDESERSVLSREFAERVSSRCGIDTVLLDERFTTAEAIEIMKENNIPLSKKDDYVDMIAAEVILQEYLDNNTVT